MKETYIRIIQQILITTVRESTRIQEDENRAKKKKKKLYRGRKLNFFYHF